MRLTIERMRTMVLIAGVLLVIALGAFLAVGKWKNPLNRRDLPKHLGINIQQEANGFTHAEFRAGHALFKITASRVEQLKDDRYRLHSVKIDMYGANGGGTDSIEGSEFEYDQRSGIAQAEGPVEITLIQSGRSIKTSGPESNAGTTDHGVPAAPQALQPGEIRVMTSGLTFDQHTGIATTAQHVEFQLAQGSGSALGASYDSQNGSLILDRAVQLVTMRGQDPVALSAQHGEFEQAAQVCRLVAATVKYREGDAQAGRATIWFRDDGSAEKLDVSDRVALTSAARGRLGAATGTLFFDQDNNPTHGHLEGGVTIDSVDDARQFQGSAPTAQLNFAHDGALSHAHLERGVQISSEEKANNMSTQRTWLSPVADLDFNQPPKGQLGLSKIHGTGGVIVTADSRHGSIQDSPSRLAADDVTGIFGPESTLTSLTGVGHASIEQTTQSGTKQSTTGDRFQAHFTASSSTAASSPSGNVSQVESGTMDGNVVLTEQAPAKASTTPTSALRATAQRAVYEALGEWIHLTGSPRVENGGLQLSANKIDFSQASGDAFAHGQVKATWFGNQPTGQSNGPASRNTGESGGAMPTLGAQGPAHVVSSEAQLQQRTGEATFRGDARLWQEGNSIAGPVIVLNRVQQTLVAEASTPANPVKVVLVSSSVPTSSNEAPSVIRVRGGDLKYSDAERKAVMRGNSVGNVIAETATATTRSNEVELTLLPPGNHNNHDGAAAQVDRMTARGNVTINSMGRKGNGDQLVYSGATGEYTLTGSPSSPPRLTDPTRGTITGEALIFNSRDDSVNVEGGSRQTVTETTVPKRP